MVNWPLLGGSIAAILALGGTAFALWPRRKDGIFGERADAMRAAGEAVPGFIAISAVIGADGRGALVFGDDRRVVVLKATGTGIAARVIPWRAVRATGQGMLVETSERRFGTVALPGVDALDIRRLAPQLTEA